MNILTRGMGIGEANLEGNRLTERMHFYTMHELKRMHLSNELRIAKILPEQNVLLEKHGVREGKYDFLIESAQGKLIGIEVLTRPTQGKMKEKMCYAEQVDEFVFVLPSSSMELYRKRGKKLFHSYSREKRFSSEFAGKKLYVWLFDLKTNSFPEKAQFSKVFNVESR